MKGHITAYGIANTVKMAHSQRHITFLLLEGPTDVIFFRRFLDVDACEALACHGRLNALQATAILDEGHEAGFLTFVDADYDRLLNTQPKSSNCVLSDGHDLIIDILCSPSLSRLLGERGSAEKLKQFREESGSGVWEAILNGAASLGYVRWHSHAETLSLSFAGLELHSYTKDSALRVDVVKVIRVVVQRSGLSLHEVTKIESCCAVLALKGVDVRQVASGHDAVNLLSFGLRGALGSQKAQDVKLETLEIELRLGFDDDCLRRTTFYQAIKEWEARNVGWPVLRQSLAA